MQNSRDNVVSQNELYMTLEEQEVQAVAFRPRPAPYCGRYIVLRVDDAQQGWEMLRRLNLSYRDLRSAERTKNVLLLSASADVPAEHGNGCFR